MPNSSSSIRSGVIVAALITTKGLRARCDMAWIVRAVSSLPAPDGPMISTRLFVGATRSIMWRRLFIALLAPSSSGASPLRWRSCLISRLSEDASSARSVINTSRSALNGFSI